MSNVVGLPRPTPVAECERSASPPEARSWLGEHVLRLAEKWRRRRAISELRGLDDRALRDMGIERQNIPEVVDRLLGKCW